LATAKDEQFVFAAAVSTAGQTTNTSLEDASAQKAATTNSVTTETIQDTALEPGGLTLAEYVAAHHLDHWIVT
jgi:hypothetical protein